MFIKAIKNCIWKRCCTVNKKKRRDNIRRKQNFPLKYFLGENENAMAIQISAAITANFLLTEFLSRFKKQ